MNRILEQAAVNQQRAWKVIADTGVVEIWKSIGAEINLVGSLKTGLLMNNLDIDFHIYTESCDIVESFQAVARLARNDRIRKVEYKNLMEEEDRCLEWHASYEDEQHDLWQIDMIHISRDSRYAGVFEAIADRISAVLVPEDKETILAIKYAASERNQKVSGIRVYRAVMDGRVKTYPEFLAYEERHPDEGIILWKP